MDESHSSESRHDERALPAHEVQVTAEAESAAPAVGHALNLSAGGACLALQTRDLLVGDEVIVWLSFARPRQPVPATGRVVWTGGGWGRPRYGIQWTHRGPQRAWIGWASRA
jgi:PilZ domain